MIARCDFVSIKTQKKNKKTFFYKKIIVIQIGNPAYFGLKQ